MEVLLVELERPPPESRRRHQNLSGGARSGVRATAHGAISNAEGCCINCAKWVHKVRMVIVDVLWMFSSK
jgi:hypothetical protein